MSADADTARAWLTRWNATNTLGDLVPGGILADRLPKPGASPYARLEVTDGPKPEYSSATDYIDYRKVTVTLYGVGKEALGAITGAIRAHFDSPAVLDFGFTDAVKAHMRTQPAGDTLLIDEQQKAGDDVRSAVLTWIVWTHRTKG